jgi:hypothetical protein
MESRARVLTSAFEAWRRLRMRYHMIFGRIGAVLSIFLCGCAASTQSSVTAAQTKPDCSFRSPTTCWTVWGRFPAMRSKPTAAPLDSTPRQSPASVIPPPTRVAVLSIALNDLSNQPASPELPARMQRLVTALREHLATGCGYQVVTIDSLAERAAGLATGYLYAHPDVAARLAAGPRAEWIVIPRLNRASPWVTDLQAHVMRVRDTALVSNRIVELKGIEHAAGGSHPALRRCPA